ncbi:MAG: site-2 protease family protein [Acidimicrobiia bacterium]|nr:site-2 protease family protein [Acidimicrobiia bacterium]MBT8194524.1 site-2 protease family protein [Acidimicrobiia bacterium]NNF87505.1 site-2 protease family protein [Acidimicrobiia bacterium]NNL97747.1 site-2 protease family protein [Acidimicrobiia bacterium]
MRSTFTLGRIGGIKVGINWTVLVIAGLITLSLASGILPSMVEGRSDAEYLIGGIIGAIGLLGSILAHELGHALMGRRHGLKVDSITLWLFGGLAQLEGELPSARIEAKVAGIGPAISLFVGVVGVGSAFLLGTGTMVGALLGWLGLVNLVLAVFNLLPGAPLDGGRLLHAFIWARTGDRHRATRSASTAGRYIGFGLMGIGAIEFFAGSVVGGLWTSTIGWVLVTAAGAEARNGETESGLEGLTIGQLYEPMTAVPDWLVVDEFVLRHVLPSRQTNFLLVGFDGRPSGYVTIKDLTKVGPDERLVQPVRRFARSLADVPVVVPGEPAKRILNARQAAISPVLALVVEDGEPIGMVTRSGMAGAIERARLVAPSRRRHR